jgi:hypothetical protein
MSGGWLQNLRNKNGGKKCDTRKGSKKAGRFRAIAHIL